MCNKHTQGRQKRQRGFCEKCAVEVKSCEGCQVSQGWQRYSATPPVVQDLKRGWKHGAKGFEIPRLPDHLQAAMCMLTSGAQSMSGISSATHLCPVGVPSISVIPVKQELLQPW